MHLVSAFLDGKLFGTSPTQNSNRSFAFNYKALGTQVLESQKEAKSSFKSLLIHVITGLYSTVSLFNRIYPAIVLLAIALALPNFLRVEKNYSLLLD